MSGLPRRLLPILELLLTTCDVRFRVDVQDLLNLLASFNTDTTICGIGTDVVISEINYNPCSTCAPSASLTCTQLAA